MRAYCPHSPMVGIGWLEGWRLTFAGEDVIGWEGAVSTVVESPGDRVFVALYDIHPYDAAQLDEIEGVTSGTYRKLTVRVSTLDGDVTAWVYVFDGYEGGLPTSWYLSEIANAPRRRARRTTTSATCGPGPPAPRRRSSSPTAPVCYRW